MVYDGDKQSRFLGNFVQTDKCRFRGFFVFANADGIQPKNRNVEGIRVDVFFGK